MQASNNAVYAKVYDIIDREVNTKQKYIFLVIFVNHNIRILVSKAILKDWKNFGQVCKFLSN